jgi:hypothetical protein
LSIYKIAKNKIQKIVFQIDLGYLNLNAVIKEISPITTAMITTALILSESFSFKVIVA